MNQVKIEAEHIHEIISEGVAKVVSNEIASEFVRYLEQLSWSKGGASIEWDRVPHFVIDVSAVSDAQRRELARKSRAGRRTHLLVLYSSNEPGLLADFKFVIDNYDLLFWGAPGVRYMCGASVSEEKGLVLYCDELVEFDGADRLTFAS